MLAKLTDIAERVVTTFVLAYAGLLLAGGVTNLSAVQSASAAGLAAGLSLVLNVLLSIAGAANGQTWWQDGLLRVTTTYLQTFIGLAVVNNALDFHQVKPALVAALPAALSALKAAIVSKIGDPTTAGLFSSKTTTSGPYVPKHADGDPVAPAAPAVPVAAPAAADPPSPV